MAINEPDGEAPPRLFLARGRANHLVQFRSDVPPPTVEACLRLCALLALGEANATRAAKTLTYRTAVLRFPSLSSLGLRARCRLLWVVGAG